MNPLIIFILIASEISLILAHLGRFSIWPIGVAALCVLVIFKVRPRTIRGLTLNSLPIIAIASLFFFQPYQYMDGGWDPGNYINTGVHIARTGSVVYHDDMLKETAGFIRADGTGVKYPGLYVKDAEKGLVVPQFFHLYPVWIAIFYKFFGLKSAFYVNPIFALLSVILMYLIGKRYGFLSAVLLSLNVIQIWNARFPTSEILGQFLLLGGFYFWFEYLEKGDRAFAFWAGVSFGEFLLAGITSFLIIPILVVYLVLRHKKRDIYFIIPFFCLLIHLVLQLIFYSSIYLESVIMFFRKKELYLGGLLFIGFLSLFKTRPKIIAFVVPILFIYGYFIRPRISSSIEALNLVELANWLSLLGLALAMLGLITIIYKEKNEGLLLFVITSLVFAIFFIYDKRMFSRYPFALRRYIPVVIPAYCLCISYLKRFGRFISILIIPLVIAIPFYRCRDIITVKDHHGWLSFWADFAGHMDNNAVYISNNYRWARPLTDIFGKKVITSKTPEKGEYYISDSNQPYSLVVDFIEVYNKSYKGEYLEHSLAFPPRRRDQEICFRIYKVQEIGPLDKDEYIIDIGEENMGLLGGFDKARRFSGIEGTARWTFTPLEAKPLTRFNTAKLVIPWFGDNVNQVLTIMAGGMSKEAGESIISIYIYLVRGKASNEVNDQPIVENYKIDEEMKEYIFCIPSRSIDTDNTRRAVLTIISNTWSPSQYGINGFPDGLGILMDWVKIKKEDK